MYKINSNYNELTGENKKKIKKILLEEYIDKYIMEEIKKLSEQEREAILDELQKNKPKD